MDCLVLFALVVILNVLSLIVVLGTMLKHTKLVINEISGSTVEI